MSGAMEDNADADAGSPTISPNTQPLLSDAATAPADGPLDAGTTIGSVPADAGATGRAGPDPSCDAVDSDGFFSDCSTCASGDCDTISVGSRTRYACGCSGGCPCGLGCGSYDIAPGISVGNICRR
ncbi:MAG: hypothetical protein OEZ06_10840 [Myxococcales bacterium]|nr:hypothetical protein [Myxococcales bacterium]